MLVIKLVLVLCTGYLHLPYTYADSIYAILAVSFYKDRNAEFFGTFSRALFTLFQVCTGDGWASDIARPLFHGEGGTGVYSRALMPLIYVS